MATPPTALPHSGDSEAGQVDELAIEFGLAPGHEIAWTDPLPERFRLTVELDCSPLAALERIQASIANAEGGDMESAGAIRKASGQLEFLISRCREERL